MTILIEYFIFFLAASGMYAIVKALGRLNKSNPQMIESTSAIQTKWFKWLAPTGLIYGVLAIVGSIFLIKHDAIPNYENTISGLQQQVKHLEDQNRTLKNMINDTTETSLMFYIAFNYSGSKPIFGARILLTYQSGKFIFNGSQGVANEKDGPFLNNWRDVNIPDKFYLKLSYNEIWGVNVFRDEHSVLLLQFYKS